MNTLFSNLSPYVSLIEKLLTDFHVKQNTGLTKTIAELTDLYYNTPDFQSFLKSAITLNSRDTYFFTKPLGISGNFQTIVSNLTVPNISDAKIMLNTWSGNVSITKIFLANNNLVCNFKYTYTGTITATTLDIIVFVNHNCTVTGTVDVNFTDSSKTVYAMN